MAKLFSLYIVCTIFIIFFIAPIADAKGMWGSRKRKEDEAQAEVDANSNFENLQRRAEAKSKYTAPQMKTPSAGGLEALNDIPAKLGNLFETYLNMMDELMESPDFDTMVTPQSIQTIIDQIPGLSSNPELQAMITSPQFADPVVLKQTMQQGLAMMRAYSGQIISTLRDPEAMAQLLDEVPEEYRGAINGILSGDFSEIKSLIDAVPGLTRSQRKMINGLMDGNMDSMIESIKGSVGDDEIEAARLQFLSDPSMAEALGIPTDVLNDKKQWAELMAQSLDMLTGEGGLAGDALGELDSDSELDNDKVKSILGNKKMYGGARAA